MGEFQSARALKMKSAGYFSENRQCASGKSGESGNLASTPSCW